MNIFSFIFIFSLFIFHEISAKSGGRGGGGGGRGSSGRGSSGARSSSRSFSRSGGSGGGKWYSSSSHSTYINHDSSSFRSTVFSPSTSKTYFSSGTTTNSYIISQPSTPIIYDNTHYYWYGYYRSRPERETYCQYAISEEDGELFNVTFSNGTSPKYITFGCASSEYCCGMTCCSTAGGWISVFVWILLFFIICCFGCCRSQ